MKDLIVISDIADRAIHNNLIPAEGKLSLMMDIDAAHENQPIDLRALLDADLFNFCHDVGGIQRHLNRAEGKLENCFRPRFAVAS